MPIRNTLGALLALLLLVPSAGAQDLIITGVIDGPLPGGLPKAAELYVVNDIPDLSTYGIGSANNGGGSDGEEFTFSGTASAGDFLYVATEDVEFANWFGFAPDFTDGALAINGDDAVELFQGGAVIDTFGDINVDGNGEAWEYLDGWAYRSNATGPDGTTFELGNWFFSGPNALDGEASNATAASPFPVGTYEAAMADGATVAFSAASGTAEEGGTVTVDVVLSITGTPPAGDIVVDITPTDDADASADVTTLTFTAPMDGDAQTVTLTATDDDEAETDEIVTFSLAVTSGDATVGAPGSFALTVTDNDTAQMVSLAEARALGPGALVQVTGTVSRAMGAFTYFQDDTGGLTIRQTGGPFRDDVEAGAIAPGVELTVTGQLSEFRELLQINGGDLQEYVIGAQGMVPAAQVVTLAELAANGEAYEAELVRVVNVTLDPDGDAIFDSSTNYAITDPSDTSNAVALRVVSGNDTMIDGTAIPLGRITVTGVVGQFNNDDPPNPDAGYQLLPIQRDDVAGTPGANALLQVIHNAPDRRVAVVDVFVNGARVLNNVAFQTGTAFLPVPSNVALDVAVGPRTAQSADDAFFSTSVALMPGVAYQAVAIGVQDPERFLPNPEGLSTAFTLALNADAKTEADDFPFNVEVNFQHGTPDAPTVDIRTGGVAQSILFDDIAYGSFSELYQPIAPQMVTVEVTSADGTVSFGEAELDLSGRGGEAATALATGFADPVGNRNSAPLGVLVVTAGGDSFVAPVATVVADESDAPLELALSAPAPNPATSAARIGFSLAAAGDATLSVYDALGRQVAVLAEGPLAADRHERTLDTDRLAAGLYVVRLQTAEGVLQQTLTVVR